MLAAVMLLSANTFAQNKITGKLLDAESNKPLQGATIQLLKSNKNTLSNANGEFTFNGLANNEYTIKISYVGFETIESQLSPSNETVVFKLQVASFITD